jgi:hypothetical protein
MNLEVINKKLKDVLGMFTEQTPIQEATLEFQKEFLLLDGTKITMNEETMEASIVVVDEMGAEVLTPIPVGEHETQSMEILVVTTDGKVDEVKAKEEMAKEEPKDDKMEAEFSANILEFSKVMANHKMDFEKVTNDYNELKKRVEELESKPVANPLDFSKQVEEKAQPKTVRELELENAFKKSRK